MKKTTPTGAACKVAKTAIREINQLHDDINDAGRTMLDKAIRIGELLTDVKDSLDHGKWLVWLHANVEFSQQTASNYMRVFRERDKLKLLTVSNLTDAYALLAEPKAEPQHTDEIALAPEVFKKFNQLSPDNRLVIETTLTIFSQQGRAVMSEDVAELIDNLSTLARN